MGDDPKDTSAHDAAMAAVGEQATIVSGKAQPGSTAHFEVDPSAAPASDEGKPQRPENVPEKFWDAEKGEVRYEALLEAYSKLESNRGKPDESSEPGSEGDGEGDDGAAEGDAESVVARAQAEFEESGELSDATYEALEKQGVDRETVDAYISGIEAQRELAFTAAGGEESYSEMIAWAGKNLTQAEITAFDKAVTEGTPKDLVKAVQGLSERFRAGRHREPSLLEGRQSTGISGFRSKAELTAAMSDPRYKTDSAFRAEVAEKIAAAEQAGVNLFM